MAHSRFCKMGGLIQRSGGWSVIKALRREKIHFKSDERILGDFDFVDAVHELGFTMTELAQKLKTSHPTVSISVQRGARIKEKSGYSLLTE